MRLFFPKAISLIFHPIFMVFYMMSYVFLAFPEAFSTPDPRQKVFIILSFLTLSVMFPLLGIALLKWQGLISSFQMNVRKERIGPLIVIAIFYLWLYVNIKDNTLVPGIMSAFVLGSVISIFIGLFINSFSKISLHCVGAGGVVAGIIFLMSGYTYPKIAFQSPLTNHVFIISNEFILLISILLAGCIGMARLRLSAHHSTEIWGGYMAGILSQILAIIFYF